MLSLAWDVESTKPSEEGLTVDIEKGYTVRNSPSINSIGCQEYPSIKWHQICQKYKLYYQRHLDVKSTCLERTVA